MITMKTSTFSVARSADKYIQEYAVEAVAAAGIAFAAAAAAQVHVWTGYTHAIWEGVGQILASRTTFQHPSIPTVSTKPWYWPPWPCAGFNTDIVLEDPSDQHARGLSDAQDAIKWRITPYYVALSFRIPEYPGEVNYSIRESDWQSLTAGRAAFDQALSEFKASYKTNQLLQKLFKSK